MGNRIRSLVLGLLAIGAIAATLVGPPTFLVRFVGNPLPASLPSMQEIIDGLSRTGIDDQILIKGLTILAWIVWAQLAVALLVEIASVVRRANTVRLPVLPGLQPLASWLVGAVLLMTSTASPSAAAVPLGQVSPAPVAVAIDVEYAPTHATPPTPAPAEAVLPTIEYRVQKHDSLWSIAEAFLDDGFRWREIRDLNVGRPQPDGLAVTVESEMIKPGWVLVVPDTAGVPAAPATRLQASVVTVEKGDSLWSISEDALEDSLGREATDAEITPVWADVIDLNRSNLMVPQNPSLIFPGQEIAIPGQADPTALPVDQSPPAPEPVEEPVPDELPSSPTPGQAPPTTAPVVAAPPTTSDAGAGTPDREKDDESNTASSAMPVGLLGIAGTGLSVALLASIGRRRRRAARSGGVPPALPEVHDELRQEVHASADLDSTADIKAAMDQVGRALAVTLTPISPLIVQISHDRIEVLLTDPSPAAPTGWSTEGDGLVWWTARPVPSHDVPADCCPSLVTIGADDDGEVLINLEAAGLVSIDGARDEVAGLARSLMLELQLKSEPSALHLVVDEQLVSATDEDISTFHEWVEVAADAEAWARQSLVAVSPTGPASVIAARVDDEPPDGLTPLVAVLDGRPSEDQFAAFAELAAGETAACAVVLGESISDQGVHIIVDDGMLTIPRLRLKCQAQYVSFDLVEQVDALLDDATHPALPFERATADVDEPVDEIVDLRETVEAEIPDMDEDWPVVVRVLGEIGVDADGADALRPKQIAILTYVALHPDASADKIESAIWPGPMESRRKQLHNNLSKIRAALGPDVLPAAPDGLYSVGAGVTTDLSILQRRLEVASALTGCSAAPVLRRALELVTGPVFSYRSPDRVSFSWIDMEQWIFETEAVVADAAVRLVELCSDAGDRDGIAWAARRGFIVSPCHTGLTDALLEALIAAGDHTAAEEVYRSHRKALESIDIDDPDASTEDLAMRIRSSA